MENCIICAEPLGNDTSVLHNVEEFEAKELRSQAYKLSDSSLRKKFYIQNLRLHSNCFTSYLNQKPQEANVSKRQLRSSGLF